MHPRIIDKLVACRFDRQATFQIRQPELADALKERTYVFETHRPAVRGEGRSRRENYE